MPLNLIDVGVDQPRKRLDRVTLEELVASIQQHGVLQPIRVRQVGERFEVVVGQRRVKAAKQAGLTAIPGVVARIKDNDVLIQALVENIQRDDLNHVERSQALRRLRIALGAGSWEDVGRRIGISRRHVYHLLNVAELPDPIREDLEIGLINEKHCRALARLRSEPDQQIELWRKIVSERLSGDQALNYVRELKAENAAGTGSAGGSPEVEQELDGMLRFLGRASVRELRPLRPRLEALHRLIVGILTEAFEGVDLTARRATHSRHSPS